MYILIKINEKRFIINKVLYKNQLDLLLKSEEIPILWNIHFMKIANDGSDRNIRTKRSNQHRQETQFIINK